MGLNFECRAYVESMSPRGVIRLLSKPQDEVWDFFEKLAWDTYAFEQAKQNFGYPTHGKYAFHANPYYQDHFMNSRSPSHSYVPPMLCDYSESSDYDVHTYPYRAHVVATYASVEKKINEFTNKMVETMKERIVKYS